MRYFSMFSGIGGFELGIQRACDKQLATIIKDGQGRNGNADEVERDVLPTSRITPLCVGYSEIDKYAIKVYERHFDHGNYGNYRDATTIRVTDLPDFDLLVGGFPCQAFSIAGKRKGFDDTRGTLFFDIARILAEKRPRHLVLENVKGLLSHDSGKTFQTILGVLSDLGYRVEWQVLNSKDFGVPQNRERIYFIGHLRGECSGEVLPITGTNGKDIVQLNQPKHSNDRVYGTNGVSPTLNTMQGGNRQPFIHPTLDANYYKGQSNQRKMLAVPVLTPDRPEKRQNGRRMKENGEPAFTVTTQDRHGLYDGARIRRLAPLECERLQGFPDDWTKYGFDNSDPLIGTWEHWYAKTKDYGGTREEWERLTEVEISDTQRYKMCGNAVTVNVVEAVMTNLIKHMEE